MLLRVRLIFGGGDEAASDSLRLLLAELAICGGEVVWPVEFLVRLRTEPASEVIVAFLSGYITILVGSNVGMKLLAPLDLHNGYLDAAT